MKKNQIAAQLYTIREFTQTPQDIAQSMKKIKAIGFDAVQISGFGPIDYKELAKILDGEGLIACASHDGGDEMLFTPEKVAERLQLINCKYTAYPWPHTSPMTEADILKLAKQLDASGAKLREAGITLCYHNHAMEFTRFGNRVALDMIYEETNPEHLQAELDTYWVQTGGCVPEEWCAKYAKRMPLLHLKEYGIVDWKPVMMEVGYGNLNWKKIIDATEKGGYCKWFIIEEDVCRFDPFVSLKMSFDYLVEHLCEK